MKPASTVWTGTIRVGFVRLGVSLQAAAGERGDAAHLFHSCGARIKMRQTCEDGHAVLANEVVKAVENKPGVWVQVDEPRDDTFLVTSFAPVGDFDEFDWHRHYFVVPREADARTAALLARSMGTRRAGVGTLQLRSDTPPRLAALRLIDDRFLVSTLLDSEEMRHSSTALPRTRLLAEEIKLGRELVATMTHPFERPAPEYPDLMEPLTASLERVS